MKRKSEREKAFALSEILRDSIPNIKIMFHLGNESKKKQMKKAKQYNAQFTCLLSSEEFKNEQILIQTSNNYLDNSILDWSNLVKFFKKRII